MNLEKPISLAELMKIPMDVTLVPLVKEINEALVAARKAGKRNIAVKVNRDDDTFEAVFAEYTCLGYGMSWDKYTETLYLSWD